MKIFTTHETPLSRSEGASEVAETAANGLLIAGLETSGETRKLGVEQPSSFSTASSDPETTLDINVRTGGGLLGSPAPRSPSLVTENAISVFVDSVTPPSDRYLLVVSTPAEIAEAMAFFAETKAAETTGQSKRANSLHGSVFSLMQWRRNPRTGQLMLTQEQIDSGLTKLQEMDVLDLHADIWQNRDTYNTRGAEERTKKGFGQVQAGDFVPLHNHMTLKLKQGCELTVRQVSDAFAIPSARVKLPREAMSDAPQGRGAALKAFLDLTAYLTHELCAGDASA